MRLEYRWQVLFFALIMQTLVIGVGVYCFAFFVVHWVEEFNTPRSELMLGFMGMTLVAGLMAPFSGMLIDRFKARPLITVGVLTYSIGLMLVTVAPGPLAIILIFWLIMPLGMALAGPLISQTLVAQAFTSKRGMALGITALGTSIGGFTMPIVATTLLTHWEWRPVMIVLAIAISAIVLPLAYLIVREQDKTQQQGDTKPATTTRELLRDRDVYLLGAAYFIPASLFVAVLQNLGLYAQDLSITQQQAGFIVGGAALIMALGKFTAGSLADRFPHHYIFYTLLILAGSGLAGVALSTTFLPLAATVFLLGASAGGVLPLISTVAAHRFGVGNFGRAMGIIMGFASLSGVAPLTAGWLRDMTGSYEIAFLVLAPLIIPSIICFSRLTKLEQT